MKKFMLLVAAFAALAMAGSVTKSGTLSAICTDCGAGADPNIVINGTGYQSGGHNQLTVIVWGSSNPVNCTTPDKLGNFTCTTFIDGPGWYNIVAYQNPKTVVAATGILIY